MVKQTNPEKFILDACCGARQMWFNKKHPNVIYQDIREESKGFSKWQPTLEIKPDVLGDFKKMDFPDKSFKLVVADPPHFVSKKLSGAMQLKYGGLHPETWQSDLKKAFNEMWRVLDDYGVLIIKWNDYHVKFKDMLKQIPFEPLFGNISTSGRNSTTKWFCFMKIPKSKEQLIALNQNSPTASSHSFGEHNMRYQENSTEFSQMPKGTSDNANIK